MSANDFKMWLLDFSSKRLVELKNYLLVLSVGQLVYIGNYLVDREFVLHIYLLLASAIILLVSVLFGYKMQSKIIDASISLVNTLNSVKEPISKDQMRSIGEKFSPIQDAIKKFANIQLRWFIAGTIVLIVWHFVQLEFTC